MGTRGLIGFIIRGVKKGAYNQCDSYPEGLGNDIVKFILSLKEEDISKMQTLVEALKWVPESDSSIIHNRDLLERIWKGQQEVVDATDFMNDGLFCEWAYLIDFEKHQVSVNGLVWAFKDLAIDCFGDPTTIGKGGNAGDGGQDGKDKKEQKGSKDAEGE